MNGTKKFFVLLIFPLFFAAAFITGCSSPAGGGPIGSLLAARGTKDYIKAVPKYFLYETNGWFVPEHDVDVFSVSGEAEELIDIYKVEFKIIENSEDSGKQEIPVSVIEGLALQTISEGVKTVVVTYLGMKTSYHINVGQRGTGEVDDSGGIIIIIP
jgi:hypothetical protein